MKLKITGRDWARTLLTYPLELGAGQAQPGAVRLTDRQGQEVPCQLSRLTTHADGSIASARISFFAALPKGGYYRYTFETGEPASGSHAPKATVDGGYMTLDNGQVALRLPAGERNYAERSLMMVMDRTAAVQNLAGLEKAGLAFGPIAGTRLNDGSWVGGSYFTAESIESVRHRQKYRPDAPGAELDQKAVADAPKVVAYRGQIPHDSVYTPANDGTGGPFTIGRVIHSSRSVGFTGWIGGVAVFHRALTGEEIKRLDELICRSRPSPTPPNSEPPLAR